MYKILGDTLAYLEENPKDIDNATKDAFLYYRDLHMKRQFTYNCKIRSFITFWFNIIGNIDDFFQQCHLRLSGSMPGDGRV